MSIETMTDQEKSVALARLCGWSVWYYGDTDKISSIVDNAENTIFHLHSECSPRMNLYDPANMALAWRVLNWWYDYIATTDNDAVDPEDGFFDVGKLMHGVWAQPPAAAQRAWLDKILTLAIAAGMVTE